MPKSIKSKGKVFDFSLHLKGKKQKLQYDITKKCLEIEDIAYSKSSTVYQLKRILMLLGQVK